MYRMILHELWQMAYKYYAILLKQLRKCNSNDVPHTGPYNRHVHGPCYRQPPRIRPGLLIVSQSYTDMRCCLLYY